MDGCHRRRRRQQASQPASHASPSPNLRATHLQGQGPGRHDWAESRYEGGNPLFTCYRQESKHPLHRGVIAKYCCEDTHTHIVPRQERLRMPSSCHYSTSPLFTYLCSPQFRPGPPPGRPPSTRRHCPPVVHGRKLSLFCSNSRRRAVNQKWTSDMIILRAH